MTERLGKQKKIKTKLVAINASIPEELRDRVRVYANNNGRKLQHVVQCALHEYIERIANPAR